MIAPPPASISENVERTPATDRPPPPPPDKPGSEGYPSRADSRRGAEAANAEAGEIHAEKPSGTDTTADSPDGQDDDATGKRETAGASKSENSATSAAEATDSSYERSDTGTGFASRPERPTPRETGETSPGTDNADRDTQRLHAPATGRDATTEPADRPSALKDHASSEGGAPADRLTAQDRGLPGATADTAGCVPADASDQTTTPITEAAEQDRPASTAESVPKAIDGLSSQPHPGRHGDIPPAPDPAKEGQPDAATPVTERPEGPTTSAESTDAPDPAPSSTETAPESIAVLPDREGGLEKPDAGAPQTAGPWRYDMKVGDMPLEAYLDRTAGDYRSPDERAEPDDELSGEGPPWVEKLSDLPSGEELRDMDSDTLSRFDKLRKSVLKNGGDIIDNSKEYVNIGHDALGRPPLAVMLR